MGTTLVFKITIIDNSGVYHSEVDHRRIGMLIESTNFRRGDLRFLIKVASRNVLSVDN